MSESIRDNDDVIALLEQDLIGRCVTALENNSIMAHVHGVFSLDDLENKTTTDLNGSIGVGVAYQGCKPVKESSGSNPVRDSKVAVLSEMLFIILLAVPSDAHATQRSYGTRLLTVLRKGILGSSVCVSDRNQRPWSFVQEKPEVDESSNTMLYYTQVWRLVLPVVGN